MTESTLYIALLAGMLATFNPCGFALLPIYLTSIILGDSKDNSKRQAPYLKALSFSLAFAFGLAVVFLFVGAVIFPLSFAIQEYLPYVTAVMGLALLVLGGFLFFGKSPIMKKFLNPNIAPRKSVATHIGYGITYALASLSCTIGPFVALTTGALQESSFVGLIGIFSSYTAGMAVTVFILATIAASANRALLGKIRLAYPVIEKVTAALLVLVGGYFLIYAWYELQVYQGKVVTNALIEQVSIWQGQIATLLSNWGPIPILIVAVVALGTSIAIHRRKKQ